MVLGALCLSSCGSSDGNLTIRATLLDDAFASIDFRASRLTYQLLGDSLQVLEAGDLELVSEDSITFTQHQQTWEHVTGVAVGDEYEVILSASNDEFRCTGRAGFTFPPQLLRVLLVCDLETFVPDDTGRTIVILGTLQPL